MSEITGKPKKLGRGLSSLLGTPVSIAATLEPMGEPIRRVVSIHVTLLDKSPYQPRQAFEDSGMASLAASIRQAGIMQPLLVRRGEVGRYELIAGERRLRAAQHIGMTTVPCVLSEISEQEAAEWALTENLQREDLNPQDKAYAFKRLVEQFGMSQTQIAERLGIDRYMVTNHLRLMDLEPDIQIMVREGKLGYAHARALLAFPSVHSSTDHGKSRLGLAERVVAEGWTVRKIDALAAAWDKPVAAGQAAALAELAGETEVTMRARALARDELERQLSTALGTAVRIRGTTSKRAKGRIEVAFYSLDQFDGLLKRMGVEVKM